ncbi:uncharacterized protein LOC121761416 [Salvia splendens]|uniref:uncharacterized protein LOC121761416 n=1 Tax=Salvia splendens TaxID=180675 RepID=UPI001C2572B7|nr:uncharacterized protein LOC121761416 [Salvia splendens]
MNRQLPTYIYAFYLANQFSSSHVFLLFKTDPCEEKYGITELEQSKREGAMTEIETEEMEGNGDLEPRHRCGGATEQRGSDSSGTRKTLTETHRDSDLAGDNSYTDQQPRNQRTAAAAATLEQRRLDFGSDGVDATAAAPPGGSAAGFPPLRLQRWLRATEMRKPDHATAPTAPWRQHSVFPASSGRRRGMNWRSRRKFGGIGVDLIRERDVGRWVEVLGLNLETRVRKETSQVNRDRKGKKVFSG